MKPTAERIGEPRKLRRWLVRGLLILLAFVVVAFFYLSSVLVAIEGGFLSKQVYSIPSPDGRAILIVTKRVIFPANDFVDPSTVVTVQLRDTATGRVLDSTKLELVEDSDLREPHIEWTPNAAHVSGVDQRHERSFTLDRNA
jgi:hypothetical protein